MRTPIVVWSAPWHVVRQSKPAAVYDSESSRKNTPESIVLKLDFVTMYEKLQDWVLRIRKRHLFLILQELTMNSHLTIMGNRMCELA